MNLATRSALLALGAALACTSGEESIRTKVGAARSASVRSAVFDPDLGAPACAGPGAGCTSGDLLVGRGPLGPEAHAPSTLGSSCADGGEGALHVDESLDALTVETLDGSALAVGKPVRVSVVVWAPANSFLGDAVDLFVAADARRPHWKWISSLVPTAPGLQTLTEELELPDGSLQAIRGVFRRSGYVPASCPADGASEADDLVFAVAGATPRDPLPDTTPELATVGGDPYLGAPTCSAAGAGCASGNLLRSNADGWEEGSTTMFGTCGASPWPGQPSIDAIAVATVDGTALEVGREVRVTVEASGLTSGTSVNLFVSPLALMPGEYPSQEPFAPVYGFLAGEHATERFETTLLLPAGREIVLRAVAGGAYGDPWPCGGTDADDLAFTTVPHPELAVYDARWQAPACGEAAAQCDSGELLTGRGFGGAEPHAPNTIDGCADDDLAWDATTDPSLQRLRVLSADGQPLQVFHPARIEATVHPLEGDAVDFFAQDWRGGPWRYLGRTPTSGRGAQKVGVPFMPVGCCQAVVRAVIVEASHAVFGERSCPTDARVDVDDLVITAGWDDAAWDQAPPSVSLVAPAPESAIGALPLHLVAEAADDLLIQRVEFWVDGARRGMSFAPPFSFDWQPEMRPFPGQRVELMALAYDGMGNVTESDRVWVTLGDLTAPTVSITSPADGLVVSRRPLTVEIEAHDDSGYSDGVTVELLADGAPVGVATAPPYVLVWDPTAVAAEGPHVLSAVARDATGNQASASVTVVIDGTPPTAALRSPVAGAVVRGAVPVDVVTADASGSSFAAIRVDGLWSGHAFNGSPWVWNTALVGDGAHQLRVQAYDYVLNTTELPEVEVVVDNTPPAIAFTSPAPGLQPAGMVEITAAPQDAVGIAQVELRAGDAPLAVLTAAPFTFYWNTAGLADGEYPITATTTDLAGNTATVTVAVLVDQTPPAVAMTAPAPLRYLRGAIPLGASATDASGIARVEFWGRNVDYSNTTDALLATAPAGAGPSFSATWDSSGALSGRWALYARAVDVAGRAATSQVLTDVLVDNTPPHVAIVSPVDGAALVGSVPIQLTYGDVGSRVSGVQYLMDGTENAAWIDPASGTWSWNTRVYADGTHTLRVRAQDSAGNLSEITSPIRVRIANGPTGSQLLLDPGFEGGAASPWSASSPTAVNLASPAAHAGQYKASLRGQGQAGTDYLAQGLVVPANARRLTFTYWLQVQTQESSFNAAVDRLDVRLCRSSGSPIVTLASHSNRDGRTTGWVQRSVTQNVAGLAGQAVMLRFEATENEYYATSFHLDDVTVTWAP